MERREEADDGERRRIQSKEEDEMSICKFIEQIPLDLIIDILLRLPAKSAVRFRCVSKLWSSILTRPDFIKWFSIQSSTRLCLLGVKMESSKRLFFSLPQQHEQPDTSLSQPDTSLSHQHYGHLQRYHIKSPKYDKAYNKPLSESVHGLLLFEIYVWEIAVWNPNTRQHVVLPESGLTHKGSFLGYDPVEGKYKVLLIISRGYHEPLVFTLQPQESWRVIHNSPKHYARPYHWDQYISVCINGHVYYQAELHHEVDGNIYDYTVEEIVMRFDVRYETFNIIRKPDDPTLGALMLNYKGKLAWFCYAAYDSTSIRFWVLEDEEKQEWSMRNFLEPVWKDVDLDLIGITHDTGEFIFVEACSNVIYVLYYDPDRKSTRKAVYKRFRDDNDFENFRSEFIGLYTNHSESLFSLENVPYYVPRVDSK